MPKDVPIQFLSTQMEFHNPPLFKVGTQWLKTGSDSSVHVVELANNGVLYEWSYSDPSQKWTGMWGLGKIGELVMEIGIYNVVIPSFSYSSIFVGRTFDMGRGPLGKYPTSYSLVQLQV